MQIGIRNKIPPAFHSLFWEMYEGKFEEFWLKGGRGSGKSSFVSILLICLLLRDREANAVIYRKVAETLRESVLSQMQWAVEQLGLERYFQVQMNPMQMVYRPTGQKILFRGADDPEKSKGVKLARGYFAALWFEEASAFRGMEEIRTIQASILRGGKGMTILSYNPPISADNWVNREALVPEEGRRVHRSDYRQMPPEWLGETFLRNAERLRKRDERAYRHMYLGEAVGTGGQVFENVTVREVGAEESENAGLKYVGLDFGFARDPDALVLCAYDRKRRRLYLLGEHVRAREKIGQLAEKCREVCPGKVVRCDSASPRAISELRGLGVNAVGVKKGAGSVEHGIRWLQEVEEIIIDQRACPEAAREFACYEYERDRDGRFLAECPDRNNHTIDAVRYALEPVITQRVVKLKTGGIQ